MMVRSSFRCSRLVSRSSSRSVTDALIEVRGVLKSCAIASRKTDFKHSLCCVARMPLVCVRVFDPLLSSCCAGAEWASMPWSIFTLTSFSIAECLRKAMPANVFDRKPLPQKSRRRRPIGGVRCLDVEIAVFIVAALEMPLYLPSAQPIGPGDTLQQRHSMQGNSRVKYPRFYCCD